MVIREFHNVGYVLVGHCFYMLTICLLALYKSREGNSRRGVLKECLLACLQDKIGKRIAGESIIDIIMTMVKIK